MVHKEDQSAACVGFKSRSKRIPKSVPQKDTANSANPTTHDGECVRRTKK